MVTEKINQAGYLYFTAGASNKAESTNKSQFTEVMENAERSYDGANKVNGANVSEPKDKEMSEEDVSEEKKTEVKAQEKTTSKDKSEVENDAKETKDIDFEKIDEELNREVVSTSVVFAQLVQQMQEQVQAQIAQELGVPMENVQESMLELGLTVEDLQNPQNLLKLIVDVMGLQGPEELLTNPQLTEAFKKLNQQITDMISDFSSEDMLSEDGLKTEQIVVDDVTEENAQTTTKDDSKSGQEMNADNGIENSVQNFTAGMKMDVAQNIQELLAERVDYETSVDIVKQVSEQVKLNMRSDVTSLEMQLYPEHLGKVSIQVVAKNGVLTAQIAAESEVAKVALESQIQTLKENFEQQGLKVESVEVMVSTRGFEQQHEHNGDASNTEKQSKQFKGAQISGVQEEENIEDSEEMKETLGNTVSYMA